MTQAYSVQIQPSSVAHQSAITFHHPQFVCMDMHRFRLAKQQLSNSTWEKSFLM